MVVDFVVVEDIGKLLDNSVVDVLQCVMGVQVVQGFQGEINIVVICGLFNVVIIYNGCEIINFGGCQFVFQDFLVFVVSGLDVYKFIDVIMVMGGIVGMVDICIFCLFDF